MADKGILKGTTSRSKPLKPSNSVQLRPTPSNKLTNTTFLFSATASIILPFSFINFFRKNIFVSPNGCERYEKLWKDVAFA